MGHTQSRLQRDAQREHAGEDASNEPLQATSKPASSHASQHDSHHGAATRPDEAGGARKRRRDSTSPTTLTGSAADSQPLAQRRRMSPHSHAAASASLSDPSISAESSSTSSQDAGHDMEIDPADAPALSMSTEAHADIATGGRSQPSDLQQRYNAVQSTDGATSGDDSGATPPPHLDALREERERARRQILETLGAAASAAAPPTRPNPAARAMASLPTPTASSATAGPGATPHPLASATIAALLGAVATGRAASDAGPAPAGSATSPRAGSGLAASGSENASHSTAYQQQRPEAARPQPIRIPLQPEMISGTSMVVQGALVARTVPNRPVSSSTASTAESREASAQQSSSNDSRATQSASRPTESASTGSTSSPGVPGSTLEGSELRGAVTLEEQAVMLSRILGIAAAATAASLLNTSESHHVDPSLLQTSLRRPFERMNQAPSDHDERWLADWQQHPRASSSSAESVATQSSSTSASSLGNGLRGRLAAALSRRVHSASSGSGLPFPRRDESRGSSTNNTDGAQETPSAGSTDTDGSANGTTADGSASRQHEIIAHLLRAAEREAASQRLSRTRTTEQPSMSEAAAQAAAQTARARSSSISTSRPATHDTRQDASRSGLSRLVRSTLGSFMHPSRLLPTRTSRSDGTASSDSGRDGWSAGTSTDSASNSSSTPSSEFSLGPNDVAGTLRQVRNGILPDGVPGSFGSFLNHLVRDLMAAVQLMRPSSEVPLERAEAQTTNYFEHATQGASTSGAEVLDGDETTEAAAGASSSGGNDADQQQTRQPHAPSPGDSGSEDVETQARRDRDFQNGNLSFFRLFRFDPVAPSQLVPCIVVGVRSLNVTERFGEEMTGTRAPGPGRDFGGSRQQTSRPTTLGSGPPSTPLSRQRAQSEGAHASTPVSDGSADANGGEELPASRFMLFVSGGRYPPNHPLLTSNPATAGRDLMILMDLLSTMQAMQHKPSTVTQQEIDASELLKIKGSQVAAMVMEGKITENMAERCLVCLEDWKDNDDCRVLACRHAFHTTCVDRWMSSSSNTCPMCRRQGVAKDGRQAGEETADSRRAAQA